MATVFETQTCTRCGGCGQYSYCQMHGSTCFGCGGTGRMLTKRGKAASQFLRSLRTKKASEVQFGDCILQAGVAGFSKTTYFRVESIFTSLLAAKSLQPDGSWKSYNHHCFTGLSPKGESLGLHTFPDHDVRIVPTKAQAAEQVAQALAYQETLTQAGTPRKRVKEVA